MLACGFSWIKQVWTRRGSGRGALHPAMIAPSYLKIDLSWATTEQEALRQAHEGWRYNMLGGDLNWDLRTPAQFEAATRFVRPEDLRETVHVSADLGQHSAFLAKCTAIGFESMDLHQVGGDQRAAFSSNRKVRSRPATSSMV
jgi:hypothetical protein